MANLNKLLLAGGFPPGNNGLNHFDKLFAQKVGDSGVIATATGNPVSIVTNKAQNAISTILSYSPKQTGQGDPSPTNIRPIEGWTEANLFGCGANILNPNSMYDSQYWRYSDGTYSNLRTDTRDTFQIQIGAFKGSIEKRTLTYPISVPDGHFEKSFTIPNGLDYDRLRVKHNGTATDLPLYFAFDKYGTFTLSFDCTSNNPRVQGGISFKDLQIQVGDTATAYEPYTQGANITANLGGTYYGFEVDVERGVLRVIYYKQSIDGDRLTRVSKDGNCWRLIMTGVAETAISAYPTIYCNRYLPKISYSQVNGTNNSIGLNTQDFTQVLIRDDLLTDFEEIKASLNSNPIDIVYPLAAPLELPLTPQTVALLAGNNTLWTDGDSIEITYKAKK